MLTARVIARAMNAYTAELRSHSRIASPWKLVSSSQFTRSWCQDPNESGLSCTSCGSLLVAASSSQITGSTKKTTNTSSSSPASSWPAARGGRRDRARGPAAPSAAGAAVSVRIEEPRPCHEQGGYDQADHQQLHRDRRRVVDIVVLEREVVGELVGRVV